MDDIVMDWSLCQQDHRRKEKEGKGKKGRGEKDIGQAYSLTGKRRVSLN